MKGSKFYKISDKIFTVVTCAVVIMFVPTLIIYAWIYYGTPPEIIFKFNRIFFSEQVIWAFVGITIFAQLLFIVSHIRRYKGNPGGKFLIAVMLLNLALEAPVVWLLFLHNLEPMVLLWVPPVFILAELTQKDFRKGTDKIFTAVTWIMAAGFALCVIAIMAQAIARIIKAQHFPSVLYGFLETNTFAVCILSIVVALAQILFVLVHFRELKSEESRKILIALILNTFIAALPLFVLYVYSPIIIFYFCATPLLIYVEAARKKVMKTTV